MTTLLATLAATAIILNRTEQIAHVRTVQCADSTPAEVRAEVLQRCEIFSKDGGFVFNAIHNVQMNTPVENIVAMIDAVKEFNGTA